MCIGSIVNPGIMPTPIIVPPVIKNTKHPLQEFIQLCD